ncbi:restriction endonuclease subunit S [Cecembia rubra]|uniref:restriction endonuclease subunit S n=1 Tax=Cecembia rubra TaxID=1485585 RepID=UPI002714D38E|nr:restriction endonuclease subunit S [Cecembia rubra]
MMEKNSIKPALRFNKFSDVWSKSPLGEISKIITGSTPPTSNPEYFGGNELFVSPADINGQRFVRDTKTKLTRKGLAKGRLVKKGACLFVGIGSTIGKVSQASQDCVTNQQIHAVEASEGFENDFLYFQLSKCGPKIKMLAGTQAVPLLNKTDFSRIEIAYPSLPEQQKIASFLSSVDERIELLERKKEKLEAYKKGVMQQIFSQQIRFKQDDGSEFPDWEEKRLGEVLKIGSGKDYKHLGNGNIPVFGTGGLMTYVDDFLYEGESVGIGRKGTIDKPMFLKGKFWTVDTLFYTHSFKQIVPRFVYLVFQTINWKVHNEASGVPSLSKTTIEKLQIMLPSTNEQLKIVAFTEEIQNSISNLDSQIQGLRTWKKGLLQQMFV